MDQSRRRGTCLLARLEDEPKSGAIFVELYVSATLDESVAL